MPIELSALPAMHQTPATLLARVVSLTEVRSRLRGSCNALLGPAIPGRYYGSERLHQQLRLHRHRRESSTVREQRLHQRVSGRGFDVSLFHSWQDRLFRARLAT